MILGVFNQLGKRRQTGFCESGAIIADPPGFGGASSLTPPENGACAFWNENANTPRFKTGFPSDAALKKSPNPNDPGSL